MGYVSWKCKAAIYQSGSCVEVYNVSTICAVLSFAFHLTPKHPITRRPLANMIREGAGMLISLFDAPAAKPANRKPPSAWLVEPLRPPSLTDPT